MNFINFNAWLISLPDAMSYDKKKYITRNKHESGTQYGSK